LYQYLYTKLLILIASTHDTKTVLYIIATPWFHLWWPGQPNSNSNSSCTKLQAPLAPARKSQKTPACFREVANPKQLQSVSMGQQWSTTSSPSVFCDARGVSSVRRFCCTTCGRIPALRQETWAMGMGMGYSLPSLPYLGLGDLGIPGSVWNLAIAPNYNYADIVVFLNAENYDQSQWKTKNTYCFVPPPNHPCMGKTTYRHQTGLKAEGTSG